MNIIQAIRDERLLLPFFDHDLESWDSWLIALRVLYGLPVTTPYGKRLIHKCTGRDPDKLPKDGFRVALFLTGRQSGKSRITSTIGFAEAVLAGHEGEISKGETAGVTLYAPTKKQGRIIHGYIRAIFESSPVLAKQVVDEKNDYFLLRNGLRIEVQAGEFRSSRGFRNVACLIDEICFFQFDAETKIKTADELVAAILPSLALSEGKLICISSPYSRAGWAFEQWQKNWGKDDGQVLVWMTDSRTMNPTMKQSVIDHALALDFQKARSEFLGEWRDDVSAFIGRDLIERLVVRGRTESMPRKDRRYHAFADLSGGRSDDAALSICHLEGRTVVQDFLKRYRPPFNPHAVVMDMSGVMKRYGLNRCTVDAYAAEFLTASMKASGITYVRCEQSSSELYAEILPRLSAGEVELVDNDVLIGQSHR